MNERIRELVEQAGMIYWPSKELDKFAELIVKECAIVANRAENVETEFRCMYDVIVEHFGIKE